VDKPSLILPGAAAQLATPETREHPVAICDRCGCLVAVTLTAAHDVACGGRR
jgi:hypothetical protein